MSSRPIAVIGASGQVGQALQRAAAARGLPLIAGGRPAVDINDLPSLSRFFGDVRPALVINAAAYTAVDKAETDEEAARSANTQGPARLAVLCEAAGAALLHFSTDYVFDGAKRMPYAVDDTCAPLSVYGRSKAAGEAAIRQALPRHAIFRIAWVYSQTGQNFLKTMLRLGAERQHLRIVADQHGAPASADDIAAAVLDCVPRLMADGDREALWGTYHLAPQGQTTWHGFATEIFRLAEKSGRPAPRLEAIATEDYPLPAARPRYSVLGTDKLKTKFGIELPAWECGVEPCFKQLLH